MKHSNKHLSNKTNLIQYNLVFPIPGEYAEWVEIQVMLIWNCNDYGIHFSVFKGHNSSKKWVKEHSISIKVFSLQTFLGQIHLKSTSIFLVLS